MIKVKQVCSVTYTEQDLILARYYILGIKPDNSVSNSKTNKKK